MEKQLIENFSEEIKNIVELIERANYAIQFHQKATNPDTNSIDNYQRLKQEYFLQLHRLYFHLIHNLYPMGEENIFLGNFSEDFKKIFGVTDNVEWGDLNIKEAESLLSAK
jgi:hypothetical protein